VPRHAARHGASAWHIAGPTLVAAIALTLSVILPGAALKFAMLCIAAPAIFSAQPVFWSLPPSFLSGPTRGGRHRRDQRDRQSGRLYRPEPGAVGA
jgi:hypothetical protein